MAKREGVRKRRVQGFRLRDAYGGQAGVRVQDKDSETNRL